MQLNNPLTRVICANIILNRYTDNMNKADS